jgi:hypothetical protein
MTLMSKAAEMVLFGTVLYSGYQLLPDVPHVPPTIDAAVFVIQQGALDIGGMGLLKLAKRANLPKDSFPVRLGVSLVVLMILNVALASLKHTLPMIPESVFVGIETALLIARAVVAVLFGHAIHALREEYSESTITVKEASELQQEMQRQQAAFTELSEYLTESEHRLTEFVHRTANMLSFQLTEQLERTMSEHPTHSEVVSMSELLTAHEHTLIELTALPTVLEELRQEVSTMKQAATEQQHPLVPNTARPKLSVVAAKTERRTPNRSPNKRTSHTESEKGAFVRSCLAETPTIRNTDIQRKASEQGITISPAYISEVHKAFTREQSA